MFDIAVQAYGEVSGGFLKNKHEQVVIKFTNLTSMKSGEFSYLYSL